MQTRPPHSIALADGRTLAWQEHGAVEGVPLMVFHGFPGSHAQAGLIDAHARRAGVRLIAPDRPGFGASTPAPDRTVLSWTRDVQALADHLRLDRFGVLGISCGGAYALACAREIGERLDYVGLIAGMGPMDVPAIRAGQHPALKLLFGLSRLHPRLVAPMLRMDERMFRRDPLRAVQRLAAMMTPPDRAFVASHPDEVAVFARSLALAYEQGIEGALIEAALIARPRGFELRDIRVPVHVYQGGHDRNVPPAMGEYIAAHVPGATYRFLPDEGHLSIVCNAADACLQDLLAARAAEPAASVFARARKLSPAFPCGLMRRPSRGSNVSERGRTDHAPLRLQTLAGRVYPFRILGMGLGVVPVMLVLYELQAHPLAWAWTVFSGYAWPHLAWLHARTARDPNRAELRNLTFDSMIAGSLVPLMHFTVLPSVVLLTVATADKVNSGVRGLWLRSLVGMGMSLLAMGLVTDFAVRAHTSMPVLLACLPILVVHTLAVSLSTYRLIRHVQKQNTRLDELSRFDALTGLESRRHWQEQASALLQRHRAGADSATLLLVDIDHFKAINDRCGHATGDDVLRGIADVIRHAAPVGSHAGRLGGDEFAIALSVPVHEAHVVAEEIRAGVATLGFAEWPELRCTVSVGVATPPPDNATLRDWTEAADRALYRAKAQGRNVVIAAVEALPA